MFPVAQSNSAFPIFGGRPQVAPQTQPKAQPKAPATGQADLSTEATSARLDASQQYHQALGAFGGGPTTEQPLGAADRERLEYAILASAPARYGPDSSEAKKAKALLEERRVPPAPEPTSQAPTTTNPFGAPVNNGPAPEIDQEKLEYFLLITAPARYGPDSSEAQRAKVLLEGRQAPTA